MTVLYTELSLREIFTVLTEHVVYVAEKNDRGKDNHQAIERCLQEVFDRKIKSESDSGCSTVRAEIDEYFSGVIRTLSTLGAGQVRDYGMVVSRLHNVLMSDPRNKRIQFELYENPWSALKDNSSKIPEHYRINLKK